MLLKYIVSRRVYTCIGVLHLYKKYIFCSVKKYFLSLIVLLMIHKSLIATIACAILLCTPVLSFAQYGGYGHGHDDHGNGHGYGHDGDDDDDDDDGNNGHGDDHGQDDDDHGNGNGHWNNGNHGWKPGKIYKENKRKPVVVWSYGRDRAQLRDDVFNFKEACSKGNQKISRR